MGETTHKKRPVEVEAHQWTGPADDGVDRLTRWVGGPRLPEPWYQEPWAGPEWPLAVWCAKSEAFVRIAVGDWLIREPDGSGVYPCHADVFDVTYEPLAPPASPRTGEGQG